MLVLLGARKCWEGACYASGWQPLVEHEDPGGSVFSKDHEMVVLVPETSVLIGKYTTGPLNA